MSCYICHGFSDELSNGRSQGVLEVSHGSLTFVVAEQRLHMPMEGASIRMGGANNRLIFFSHVSYPQWEFYVSDRTLLDDEVMLQCAPIRQVLIGAKRHHIWAWARLWLMAACIVMLPLALLFRMDILTGVVAKKIPPEWEHSLGRTVYTQFSQGNTMLPDTSIGPLLDPLVSPLLGALPSSRYEYAFYVMEDSSVNAFALPGGTIVIHSGLILKADSPEELLGVVAHEIIHVEQQHGVRNLIGSAGIYILFGALIGDASGAMAMLTSAAPLLLNQRYSRRFESDSDLEGLQLLQRANINSAGLLSFFNKLQNIEAQGLDSMENDNTKALTKDALVYLSSHPATEQRIKKIRKAINKMDAPENSIDLSQAFRDLQHAVKNHLSDPENNESSEHEN